MARNGKCFIYYIEAMGSSYGLLWEVACIEKLTHYRLASYWKEHWYGPRYEHFMNSVHHTIFINTVEKLLSVYIYIAFP